MNKILNKILNSELCTGCGACTVGSNNLMGWNNKGFLEPNYYETLEDDANKYCPFNLTPDKLVRTENELAELFLPEAPYKDSRIGRYYNSYVGYSDKYRETSSSGGLATYLTAKLLEDDQVDYVVSVGVGDTDYYDYQISNTVDEVLKTSKTKYYPVSMANVLKHIENNDGRYAIVGTACFVKAVRLLQYYNPLFKERVKFVVGIICGGQKSRYYTDFLASRLEFAPNTFHNPQFRVKDKDSYALDYSFSCINNDDGEARSIKMQGLGDMWGTGLFKNNACDFCDDVTSELADISLGDAWIEPYSKDGKGTNVIVTRSPLADNLVRNGWANKSLVLEELPFDKFIQSQQGSFNHRHTGLAYRMKLAKKNGTQLPPKRSWSNTICLDFKLVQKQRLKVRKISLEYWLDSPKLYLEIMDKDLRRLKLYTRFNHYIRAIKRRLK